MSGYPQQQRVPPQQSSAIFDPAALKLPRFNAESGRQMGAEERPWPAPALFKPGPQPQPQTRQQADIEEMYQSAGNTPNDKGGFRPPSRAASSIYGGSGLYQPLTQTPLNNVWGNSTLFHSGRPPSDPGVNVAPISPPISPPVSSQQSSGLPPMPKIHHDGNVGFAPGDIRGVFGDSRRSSANFEKMPKVSRPGDEAFRRLCALQVALGVVLFSVGVSRLVLSAPKTLGMDLVYGIYVCLSGAFGIFGSRHGQWRCLAACCATNLLSCLLCLPPFVSGLLFTVPDSYTLLSRLDPRLFAPNGVPAGLNAFLSAVCLCQLILSAAILARACSLIGRSMDHVMKSLDADYSEKGAAEKRSDLSSSVQKAALKM